MAGCRGHLNRNPTLAGASAQHVHVYVVEVAQDLVAGLRCVVVLPLPSRAVYAPEPVVEDDVLDLQVLGMSDPAGLYRPKDARFHVAIAEVTGSPSLVAAVADARARVSDLLDRIPFLEPNIEHSNRQHQEIVDAILRGDAEGANQATLDHLQGTASLLHGFLVSPDNASAGSDVP